MKILRRKVLSPDALGGVAKGKLPGYAFFIIWRAPCIHLFAEMGAPCSSFLPPSLCRDGCSMRKLSA